MSVDSRFRAEDGSEVCLLARPLAIAIMMLS
jgi:hypothetical protein